MMDAAADDSKNVHSSAVYISPTVAADGLVLPVLLPFPRPSSTTMALLTPYMVIPNGSIISRNGEFVMLFVGEDADAAGVVTALLLLDATARLLILLLLDNM